MATSAKENILKKIRQALVQPVPVPFEQSNAAQAIFTPPHADNTLIFAEEFTKLQGQFLYCENNEVAAQNLQQLCVQMKWSKVFCSDAKLAAAFLPAIPHYADLADCDVSVTSCARLVARTGTIVLQSTQEHGRTASVYAPVHVCIAYTSQLVYDVKDALQVLKPDDVTKMPSFISFASGPSRTADIEKTLVTGVHGPKAVYCLLIEDAE